MPLLLGNLCTVFTSHFLDYLPCANSQCGTLGHGMPFFFFYHLKNSQEGFFPLQLPSHYVLQSAKLARTQQVAHMVCVSV